MRTDRIEWYANRNPFAPEIVELLDLGVFLPLLTKDEEQRQVIVIRVAVHDPKKHDQNNVFKTGNMILDYLIQKDETISVFGVRAIFDMTGVSLGHAKQLPPRLIKRWVQAIRSVVRGVRFYCMISILEPSRVGKTIRVDRGNSNLSTPQRTSM
jgi:CRAL/TRIO domain